MIGVLLVGLGFALGLAVLYWLIRYAVRDGMYDAHQLLERDRVRTELGVGDERRPGVGPSR